MITIHKWTCKKCWEHNKASWRWFLAVDDRLDFDRIRLQKFETTISYHIAKYGHEVIHREKVEGKIRRI